MNFLKKFRNGAWGKNKKGEFYPKTKPYKISSIVRRKHLITTPIRRYYVPLNILEISNKYICEHRRRKEECFIFWGGYLVDNCDAQIITVYYPKAIVSYGRIHLNTRDITLLNLALRKNDQLLLVELHSHPPGADGQNKFDAKNALCYHPGFITIVVPDFGYPYFYDLRKCYVYEYVKAGKWYELKSKEIEDKFIVEDTVIEVDNK